MYTTILLGKMKTSLQEQILVSSRLKAVDNIREQCYGEVDHFLFHEIWSSLVAEADRTVWVGMVEPTKRFTQIKLKNS